MRKVMLFEEYVAESIFASSEDVDNEDDKSLAAERKRMEMWNANKGELEMGKDYVLHTRIRDVDDFENDIVIDPGDTVRIEDVGHGRSIEFTINRGSIFVIPIEDFRQYFDHDVESTETSRTVIPVSQEEKENRRGRIGGKKFGF